MNVQEHFSRLGIRIIDRNQFHAVLNRNSRHPSVIDYHQLMEEYGECGDLDSTEAYYHFSYATVVPKLDVLFAHVSESFDYRLYVNVLPAMYQFCDGAKSVLDAGCGGGVVLTYLATELPKTQFMGIDRLPEPVAMSQERIKKLDLSNARAVIGDAFSLPDELIGQFDRVILADVLDDARKPYTPSYDAEFDTVHKLTELRKALTDDGLIWLSKSSNQYRLPQSLKRIEKDINESGLTIGYKKLIPYGVESMVHVVFELRPNDD